MAQPRPLIAYFRSFQTQFTENTVGFCGLRTLIVGVECKYADHLTTTTAQAVQLFTPVNDLQTML